jgi:hypothetical protein
MNIYIGWDSKYDIASKVCKKSILMNTNHHYECYYLKRGEIEGFARGEQNESTEFAFTRFLVPLLNNWQGYAIFCDNDFLFLDNISKMLMEIDPHKAVSVVKHNYKPKDKIKMKDKPQINYPRKNWSSLMVWNCSHPSNKVLTLDCINKSSASDLHEFRWLKNNEIGEIDYTWNYLTDWYTEGEPKALHFTTGGPWLKGYENIKYANNWHRLRNSI